TDAAVLPPALLADSVYPIEAPPSTVAASAVFVSARVVHCTVVAADACTAGAFMADNVAVFEYPAQLDAVVGLVTWTVTLPPAVKVPRSQLKAPLLIEQPGTDGFIVHTTPVPVGSASTRDTDAAAFCPGLLAVKV